LNSREERTPRYKLGKAWILSNRPKFAATGRLLTPCPGNCSYGNLASYYRNSGVGTGEASLRHLKRALELLAVVTGQDHPEVASTMINIAMHYHELGRYGTALRYLQVTLRPAACRLRAVGYWSPLSVVRFNSPNDLIPK
jgi:hypothetical protein